MMDFLSVTALRSVTVTLRNGGSIVTETVTGYTPCNRQGCNAVTVT